MDIFEIIFNEEDEELMGIVAMGFVDQPAIESDVLRFSKEIEVKNFNADSKKMQITGAYMIPNKKMLRVDTDGNNYEVFYSEETIERLSNWMMKTHNFNKTNIMHDQTNFNDENTNYMLEHWIKTSETDKSSDLGLDVPIGSALMTYQLDKETFAKFEEGELNGLSIELAMSDKNIKKTDMNNKFKKFYETVSDFFKVQEFEEETVVEETVVEDKVEETVVEETVVEDKVEDKVEETVVEDKVEDKPNEVAESLKEMTSILEKLNSKVDELEADNKELKAKLKKKPSAKPIEATEKPKKPFSEMSKKEQIKHKLNDYKKRHNL